MKNNSPIMHQLETLSMLSTHNDNFESIQAAAAVWSPIYLREELSQISHLSQQESEQLQRICLKYKEQYLKPTIFQSTKLLYIYASNWALLTTFPALITFMMISALGLNPFDAPELSMLLVSIALIPVMIIVYGKAILHYNTLLNHNYLLKITFIQKKTQE